MSESKAKSSGSKRESRSRLPTKKTPTAGPLAAPIDSELGQGYGLGRPIKRGDRT